MARRPRPVKPLLTHWLFVGMLLGFGVGFLLGSLYATAVLL
jgi:uncharacterized protein involved in exopolysaccharide biosynthesis